MLLVFNPPVANATRHHPARQHSPWKMNGTRVEHREPTLIYSGASGNTGQTRWCVLEDRMV